MHIKLSGVLLSEILATIPYLPRGIGALQFDELVQENEGCVLCARSHEDLRALLNLVLGNVVLGVESDTVEREGHRPNHVENFAQGALPFVQEQNCVEVNRWFSRQGLKAKVVG